MSAAPETRLSVLPGGLRLLTTPLPDSPVAAAHLWFDAGAVDEPAGQEGVAHFVEHALFKGTERRGVGEAAAEIEALGGDLNAWTSWDETCFHATLDAAAVADALDVLLDMARDSALDAGELEREKQVVIEEIRGYEEDPETVATDLLHARVFGDHPYGRPILGSPRSVAALDRAAVHDFWRSHYHPGRAVLSVTGPVDHDRIAAFVAPRVARWPVGRERGPIPEPRPQPACGLTKPSRDFGSVVVTLGWPGPAFGHPDVPALEVAWMALANASGARLSRVLDLQRGVASQVGAEAHSFLSGGLSQLSFVCGQTPEALAITRATLEEVHRHGLPRSEVIRAREALLADFRFARETTEGIGADHVFWLARTGDPLGTSRFLRQLAAVEPDDVARVALRWLPPASAEVVVIDQSTDRRTLVRAWEGAAPRPSRHRGTGVDRVAGSRVATQRDGSDIAAIDIVGLGGALLERASSVGTAEAWSRMLGRGAGPWDARTLAERCDQHGLSLDASSGRSMFGLHASFPAEELDGAIELLGELLLSPRFDDDDWDNVREEMLDDLAAQGDRPAAVAQEALLHCLFPDHPWRFPVLGTEASLRRLAPSALLHRHRRLIRPENLVIGVAGGVDPERVMSAWTPWLEALAEASGAGAPEVPVASAPPLPGRTLHAGKDQATVLAGVRGFAVDDDDRAVLWVVGALLDSQSGRLFLSLREVKGLAYGVWARADAGFGAGAFAVGLSTDPARVDEARDGLVHELARFVREDVSTAEVEKVTRMLLGLEAMRLQRVSGRAADLARSLRTGQAPGRDALAERLRGVTPARIRRVCSAIGLDLPTVVTVLPEAPKRGRAR